MTGGAHRSLALFVGVLIVAVGPACSREEKTVTDPVVALIDGEPIRRSEVERRAGWRLYRAELDVHLLLARETDRLIEERLLERAAHAAGVEVDALLAEQTAGLPPVREADIDRHLEANPADADIAAARDRIRHYLEETRRIERRLDFVQQLREAAEVEILLAPPARPRSELDLRGAPIRGPAEARVTIVHFADLSDAASARSAARIAALVRVHPEQLRVVHRSLPVPGDELGLLTAQLAAVAAERGLFWTLHDRLVEADGIGTTAALDDIARAIGLADRLPGLAGDRESLLRVRRDLEHARHAGVGRAPTLFVNGLHLAGESDPSELRRIVEQELAHTG